MPQWPNEEVQTDDRVGRQCPVGAHKDSSQRDRESTHTGSRVMDSDRLLSFSDNPDVSETAAGIHMHMLCLKTCSEGREALVKHEKHTMLFPTCKATRET